MFTKILVAIDGSPSSIYALDYAANLANQNNARLNILSVVETLPRLYTAGAGDVVREKLQDSIKEMYEKIHAEQMKRVKSMYPDLEVVTEIRYGRPATQIQEAGVSSDLIVIGHRGEGALLSWVLGSTAKEVIESCTVPVLVVKDLEHCKIDP